MAPWLRWGNTDPNSGGAQDPSTPEERLRAFCGDPPPPPDAPSDPLREALENLEKGRTNSSPLVLDLDGDGVEVSALDASRVFWDIDQDGFREQVGWVLPDDGLLALDRNGNGTIDDHSEVFGTATTDGFTILAQRDGNGDGVISVADRGFGKLRVWRDLDQDGVSDPGELFRLRELGIAQIDLGASPVRITREGHPVSHVSTYTLTTGEAREIEDIWFQFDDVYTVYNATGLPDLSVEHLPNLRGYGEVPDLKHALSQGYAGAGPLRALVHDLDTRSFDALIGDPAGTSALIDDILFAWAGVAGIDPASRGSYIDARMVHLLEAISAEPFLQRGWSPDPFIFAARDLEAAFDIFKDAAGARLMVQAAGHLLFEDKPVYDISGDVVRGGTTLNQTYLEQITALAQSNADPLAVWAGAVAMIHWGTGAGALTAAATRALDAAIAASVEELTLDAVLASLAPRSHQGISLRGTNDADTLRGGVGDDTLSATYGDDKLLGGVGADVISAAAAAM